MKKISPLNRFLSHWLILLLSIQAVAPAWANAPIDKPDDPPWWEKALDWLGGGKENDQGTDEPINTRTGNNYFTERDLSLPVTGVPIVLDRKYNSTSTYDSPFGKGWSSSFNWKLAEIRELHCDIPQPQGYANYKAVLWDGTQVACSGSVKLVPSIILGSSSYSTLGVYLVHVTGSYSLPLLTEGSRGDLRSVQPFPVSELTDASGNQITMPSIDMSENHWLEVYMGNGQAELFFDLDQDGIYLAENESWQITVDQNKWILHLPGGEQRIFDASGKMIRHQNEWEKGLTLNYNIQNQLLSVQHDNGTTVAFAYDGDHISTATVDPRLSVDYYYTNNILSSRVVSADGELFTNQYRYADGVLTQRVNAVGHAYNYAYETGSDGLLSGKGTSLGINGHWYNHTVEYTNPDLTDVRYETRGTSQLHRYTYSSQSDELTHHYGPALTTTTVESRGIDYQYNEAGDKVEEKLFDHSINQSFSTYTDFDDRHNPTNIAVAFGGSRAQISSMQWDADAQLPSVVKNAEGEQVVTAYEKGSPKKISSFYSDTGSHDTDFFYYPNGLLEKTVNANQHATRFTYDSRGCLDTVFLAEGPAVQTKYDGHGFLESTEILTEGTLASTGRKTNYDTTSRGWLNSIEYADGLTVSNFYNRLGDVTNIVDRAGRSTDITYAPESRVTSVTQYLEEDGQTIPVRISYDFDQQMNSLSITEPRGRYVESYQLDIQDRVTTVTNIEGQAMSIDYGLGSMVTNVTRFDNSRITTSYDTAGRKSQVAYIPSGGAASSLTVAYDYYADSMLKTVSDDTTSVSNTYDRLNRLTGASFSNSVSSVYSVVNYSHDPVGKLTNSTVSVDTGLSTFDLPTCGYQYDTAERLKGIFTTEGTETQSFEYTYHPENGRVATQTLITDNDSLITTYSYDLMDRATNISYRTSIGSLIRSLDYQYDALGMITNKTVVGPMPSSGVTYSYEYDTINRLRSEKVLSGSAPLRETSYDYDLAGNRTVVISVDGVGDPVTNNYSLGIGNRLQSVTSASSADSSFSYDTAGNTTNIVFGTNSLSLNWDERYRLTSAVQDSLFDIRYSYDVLGRRASRSVVGVGDPGSVTTEHYVYSGNQVAADLDDSGNILRSYTWGPGIDNLLSMTVHAPSSTNTYCALKDHQNSVLAFTDASGSIVEFYEYDAWGNAKVFNASGTELTESALGNRYTFHGREIDWDTGLIYFRARWYSSETGRWLSKDPIGIAGGLNLYAFCGNNPINFIDPLGLQLTFDFNQTLMSEDLSGQYTQLNLGPAVNFSDFEVEGDIVYIDCQQTTAELFVCGATTITVLATGAITLAYGGVRGTLVFEGVGSVEGAQAAKLLNDAIQAKERSDDLLDIYNAVKGYFNGLGSDEYYLK